MTPEDKINPATLAHVLKKLWPTLAPFSRKFAFGFGLILLSTVVEIFLPIVVGKSVDAAISPSKDTELLWRLCSVFLVLISLKAILETAQAFIIQSTGEAVTHELRSHLFSKIERLP